MTQVPILLLSDCPSQVSGLARITRDLATVLASMPEFRVATLGLMGTGSVHLPFHTYHLQPQEFGELSLPMVWDEFSRGEAGIVMTIWDLSRILWLARPEFCEVDATREWLQQRRGRLFQLWSYVPVDATGPGNRLTEMSKQVLLGIDRVLAYTPWARDVIRNTIGADEANKRETTWVPHGINTRTFTPLAISNNVTRDNACTRVGIVMTNQPRKDWGLTAAVCAAIAERLSGKVRFWWHTDMLIRSWSLPALIADYQLGEMVEYTTSPVADKWLAEQYRQCDVVLLPSLGEGFGYPLFESLACGTPVVHGDYAGGASIMRTCGLEDLLVAPETFRLDGQHNCIRPVFSPRDWVDVVMRVIEKRPDIAGAVEHLAWRNLSHVWKRWFREGLGE